MRAQQLVDPGRILDAGIEFEVQPVLKADEVPECSLSDEALHAPRLGWMSWLRTEPFEADAPDAVFSGVLEVASA